jgi:hypothetical protein
MGTALRNRAAGPDTSDIEAKPVNARVVFRASEPRTLAWTANARNVTAGANAEGMFAKGLLAPIREKSNPEVCGPCFERMAANFITYSIEPKIRSSKARLELQFPSPLALQDRSHGLCQAHHSYCLH